MKRVLKSVGSMALCMAMLLGSVPTSVFAMSTPVNDESSPNGGEATTVAEQPTGMIAPTSNESDPALENVTADLPYKVVFHIKGGDKEIAFNSLEENISGTDNRGATNDYNGGLFNREKFYFIGWSPSSKYGADDSKLYYGHETASKLKDEGVKELYPIYIGAGGFEGMGLMSKNTLYINLEKNDSQTVPGSERNLKIDTDDTDHDINLYFDKNKEKYNISLESNFEMNKKLAHWLYLGNGHTIMTNTQGDVGDSKLGARYTHVDLNVVIPEEVDVPEELKLTFEGYYFQPYMVVDTKSREKFEIKEVNGTDKWNISELVSDTEPSTTFTVKNPTRNITVRTILRTNGYYGGKYIKDIDAQTIETEQMRLVSHSMLTISKDNAKKLLDSNDKVKITGHIDGYVVLTSMFFPKIGPQDAELPVYISFSEKKSSGGSSGGVNPDEDNEDKKPTPKPKEKPQPTEETTETKLNTVDHYAYMVGYPDLTFRADAQMTRAEVTMMFARLLKDRPVGTPFMPSRYSDIVESNWYSYAVDYMSEQNIVTGYPDGTFRPNTPITRAEFAAMSARFDKLTDAGNSTFTDVSANHWASKVIAQAGSKGWVSGYPDGTFKPNQNITRAEVVSSTNRILNRYADVEFAKVHKEELAPMVDIAETHWGYEAIVEAMNGHDYVRQADGKTEKWEKLNGKSFTFPTPLAK